MLIYSGLGDGHYIKYYIYTVFGKLDNTFNHLIKVRTTQNDQALPRPVGERNKPAAHKIMNMGRCSNSKQVKLVLLYLFNLIYNVRL